MLQKQTYQTKNYNKHKGRHITYPIQKIMSLRRSIRSYDHHTPISKTEVMQLLWAAQGITEPQKGLRTTPSAGATFPLEIYLVASNITSLTPGVYKYNPHKNNIIQQMNIDKRKELCKACLSQKSVESAAANIVICGVYNRTTKKYGQQGTQYVHVEVGAAAQNMYLQATALEIGTVYIGGFNKKEVQTVLKTKSDEIPLCVMPIGKLKNNTRSKDMGKVGTEIIGVDIKTLLANLNVAFADEWLAYYQYWLGAKLAKGPMKNSVIAELEEHANDELRHAQMLAERIIQLGGTPPISPREWYNVSGCGYLEPHDPYVKTLVEQNIKGEQCAIKFYDHLLKEITGKDFVTQKIVEEIIADEVKHEEDLENILEDLLLGKH
jgi:bacterioferritin